METNDQLHTTVTLPQGKQTLVLSNRRWVGPKGGLGASGNKDFAAPARSPVTISTELSRSQSVLHDA
jgi:hypothetical protein